jgi:hypothetical protein
MSRDSDIVTAEVIEKKSKKKRKADAAAEIEPSEPLPDQLAVESSVLDAAQSDMQKKEKKKKSKRASADTESSVVVPEETVDPVAGADVTTAVPRKEKKKKDRGIASGTDHDVPVPTVSAEDPPPSSKAKKSKKRKETADVTEPPTQTVSVDEVSIVELATDPHSSEAPAKKRKAKKLDGEAPDASTTVAAGDPPTTDKKGHKKKREAEGSEVTADAEPRKKRKKSKYPDPAEDSELSEYAQKGPSNPCSSLPKVIDISSHLKCLLLRCGPHFVEVQQSSAKLAHTQDLVRCSGTLGRSALLFAHANHPRRYPISTAKS